MKKTLTINLSGTVFHIDEDAYQKLNNYLIELGRHFSEEERQEIMNDIEARIAELFTDRLQHRNVVELKDVEEVIATLGSPNQFDEAGSDKEGSSTSTASAATSTAPHRRKFFRDGTNKKIGGVAAGIAAYLDWDVTLVRVLLVLLMIFSVGWTLVGYILIWIISPEATSVAQKLEMQGVDPTIDNIRNYKPKEETPRRSSDGLGVLLKVILVVVLASIGGSLLISVLGVLIVMGMLLFGLLPGVTMGTMEILLLVSASLFFLIPAVGLVLLCVRLFNHNAKVPGWSLVVMAILFVASIVTMLVSGVAVTKKYVNEPGPHFWDEEYYEEYWERPPFWEKEHDTLYVVKDDTLSKADTGIDTLNKLK